MKRVLLGLALLLLLQPAGAAAQTTPTAPGYTSLYGQKQGSTGVFLQNADGSLASLGGNTNCLVVTGDQAWTLSTTQQLTCTQSGRLKVGLSSATNITPAAAPSSTSAADLVGCVYLASPPTWSNTWQGSIGCTADGSIRVNDSAVAAALAAQAIAKGTPGNPSNDTLSTQDNNAVFGPFTNATPATAVGAFLTQALNTNGTPFTAVGITVDTLGTGASVQLQCSMTGTSNWQPVRVQSSNAGSATSTMSQVGYWFAPIVCPNARLYQTAITSGSTTASWFFAKGSPPITDVTVSSRVAAGSTAGNPTTTGCAARTSTTYRSAGQASEDACTTGGSKAVVPFTIPEEWWPYATPAAGLTTTAGATMKAAAGSGVRNYTATCDLGNNSATATVIEIRDGASGTALGRLLLGPNASTQSHPFNPPLRGTANTLVEIAALTSGAAVIGTCTGFQAQ